MYAKSFLTMGMAIALTTCDSTHDSAITPEPAASSATTVLPPLEPGIIATRYPDRFLTPDGGHLESDGIGLVFPRGALEHSVSIDIQANGSGIEISDAMGLLSIGPQFDLGPDGLAFNEPVLISLFYSSYQASLGALEHRLSVFRAEDDLIALLPSIVHADTATVSASTSHFSRYFLAIPLDNLNCEDVPGLSHVCEQGETWACEARDWILANRNCDTDPLPECGNSIVETGETCEPDMAQGCDAAGYAGVEYCMPDCAGWSGCASPEFCGDGTVNGPEFCEPGAKQSCTTESGYAGLGECEADCSRFGACVAGESCGDGLVNGPEGCDAGTVCGMPLACACDCSGIMPATCGNGVAEANEGCDGDTLTCNDGCYDGLVTCYGDCSGYTPCDIALQRCGDGKVQGCEVCDKDSLTCTDGCYQGHQPCDASCTGYGECSIGGQHCGNGIVEGCEECDDGNLIELDGCTSACISDEILPHIAGTVDVGGNSIDVATDGNTLYLLMTTTHPLPPQTHFHLRSYDISNPILPVPLQTVELPPTSAARAIKIESRRVYILGGGSVLIFDISNPASMNLLAHHIPALSLAPVSQFGFSDFDVQEGRIFLSVLSHSDEALVVLDANDPANIALQYEQVIFYAPNLSNISDGNIFVKNGFAYASYYFWDLLADWRYAGSRVFDVSGGTPIELPFEYPYFRVGTANDSVAFTLRTTLLYGCCTFSEGGLGMFDAPPDPVLGCLDVCQDSSLPPVSGLVSESGWDIALKGNHLYISDIASFHVIDVTNPINPFEAAKLDLSSQSLALGNTHIYLTQYYNGIVIIGGLPGLP